MEADPPPSYEFFFLNEHPSLQPEVERLRKAMVLVCVRSLPGSVEVSVLLVDDPAMAILNRDYRRKEGPTDVLSFSQFEGIPSEVAALMEDPPLPGEPLPLGDIVISLDTALRQGAEAGRSLPIEVLDLLCHGLLHLLGYDHEKEDEAEVMFALQRRWFAWACEGIASDP